jgi:hypothetical protein
MLRGSMIACLIVLLDLECFFLRAGALHSGLSLFEVLPHPGLHVILAMHVQ